MLIDILEGIVFLGSIYLIWKRFKYYYLSVKLKNDFWSFPIIGHLYKLYGSDENRMKGLQDMGRVALRYKGLAKFWFGPRLFVIVVEPRYLEIILKSCLEKDDMMNIAHELFGNGSIFASVNIWRARRKVIAPTFNLKNLNQFVTVFSEQSTIMANKLRVKSGKGVFSLWRYITTYALDSVCETALGIKVNAQNKPEQPFLEAFETHCEMASFRICQPPIFQKLYTYLPSWDNYLKPIHFMWQYVDKIIVDQRKKIKENHEKIRTENQRELKQNTFLELYIKSSGDESGFTDLELREETLVLLLAGTDTSAVGTAFTCLMLARHWDVQEKAYQEVKEVFGNSNRPVIAEDLPRLKYLEMVIKESLRLYPPVPIIVRKAIKDIQLPNGLTIYKGTSFLIHIWATHRNQDHWGSNADEFHPERFITPPDHAAAFIPFSSGPRSCLGYQYAMMSMKTAIAAIIRNYKLLPVTSDDKHTPLRVKFDVMMKHVDNFEIQLESRT